MFRSFRARILILCIGLMALAEITTVAAVLVATRRNVLAEEREGLRVGGRVFGQLLRAREVELADTVKLLTSDFAFREAAATRDTATIESALENHGERVSASVALLLDLDGTVTASTAPQSAPPGRPFPLARMLETARETGRATGIALFQGVPQQLVLLPLRAPAQIGWVCMGFVVDDRLAREFKSITNLDVSFAAFPTGGQPPFLASTLPPTQREALERRIRSRTLPTLQDQPFELPDDDQLALRLSLAAPASAPVEAILQTSLSAALAPYAALRLQLLVLAVGALGISILGAIVAARSVTRPVNNLVAAAGRILGGHYDQPVDVRSGGELGLLAASFNQMQRGIADREDHIVYQAQHDTLTGLSNRLLVDERLTESLVTAAREGTSLSIVLIDIEQFYEVNDAFGYGIGDHVLRVLAERFRAELRDGTLAARLGGDDFLLLLAGDDAEQAVEIAERVATALEAAIEVDDASVHLSFRMGVASAPEHATEPGTLLRRADIALNDAKERERTIVVYETGKDESQQRRLGIIRDLRHAAERGELLLHYQPKLDLALGDVTQVEALVRWRHPERGLVRPDEFIELAEQSGQIHEITLWVLDAALAQLRLWAADDVSLAVAVNLSTLDLLHPDLPEKVGACLARHAVHPSSLILEITESAMMQRPGESLATLQRLRERGLKLAIDDFGTGHSSLAQLKRLPVDEIKIDKSFVLHLKEASEDVAIVRSIIDLGHHLGLSVVAEGMDSGEALEILRHAGCDLVQGFYLSKPLEAAALAGWLARFHDTGEFSGAGGKS